MWIYVVTHGVAGAMVGEFVELRAYHHRAVAREVAEKFMARNPGTTAWREDATGYEGELHVVTTWTNGERVVWLEALLEVSDSVL